MRILIKRFAGIAPGVNPAELPEGMAQVATNCDFNYGDLRPLRGTADIVDLEDASLRTPYYFDGEWRAWSDDVDVSRSPVANAAGRTIAFGASVDGPLEFDENSSLSGVEPTGWLLGIPAPSTGPTLTAGDGGDCDAADQVSIAVLNTLVRTRSGVTQEGPPSEAALIDLCEGQTLTIDSFTDPVGDYEITHRRIYGAVSGTYYLIAEITVATTTYDWVFGSDNFETDLLETDGWDSAPSSARGLIVRANGVGVAFDGNELLISVPYQLHAWPQSYRLSTEYPIRALIDIGDIVAVLTTGPQYLLIGSDPESMELRPLETYQACPAKNSAVDMGSYGIYAGTDGLIAISPSGETRNLTEAWYTPDKWRELIYPESVKAFNWRGSYVAFNFRVTGYTQMTMEDQMDSLFDEYAGTEGGFIYDPKVQGLRLLDSFADGGQAIFESIKNGGVTQVQAGLLALLENGVIKAFADESADYLTADWKSGIIRTPKAINLNCAQVIADAYPLTFKVYADSVLKHTETVSNAKPFRLPGGYRAADWEFEITTVSGPIRYFAAAETMQELKDI